MSHDLRDGSGSNKAKVCGAGRWTQGVRRNRGIGLVQVELVAAKAERATTAGESDRLHIQHASVECNRRLDIANGKNKVVNAINLHGDLETPGSDGVVPVSPGPPVRLFRFLAGS
jgi:hypothetical protein